MKNLECFRKNKNLSLILACFSRGQGRQGVELGPSAILEQGLVPELKKIGWSVQAVEELLLNDVYLGQDPSEKIKNPDSIYEASVKLTETLLPHLKNNHLALTLGGDHSIALGTIEAHARSHPDFCVLWIDAHANIHTSKATTTGYFNEMLLSLLIKEVTFKYPLDNLSLSFSNKISPVLNSADIAYIGLRDMDEAEKEILHCLGISYFSMREIDQMGICSVVQLALKKIDPDFKKSIHVSFDISAMDPFIAPSTGVVSHGGLSLREVFCIADEVAKTGRLNMLDLVEVNPLIGTKEEAVRTASNAIRVMLAFLKEAR